MKDKFFERKKIFFEGQFLGHDLSWKFKGGEEKNNISQLVK